MNCWKLNLSFMKLRVSDLISRTIILIVKFPLIVNVNDDNRRINIYSFMLCITQVEKDAYMSTLWCQKIWLRDSNLLLRQWKIKLAEVNVPSELERLFIDESDDGQEFRKNTAQDHAISNYTFMIRWMKLQIEW